jgi:hypothetical protein
MIGRAKKPKSILVVGIEVPTYTCRSSGYIHDDSTLTGSSKIEIVDPLFVLTFIVRSTISKIRGVPGLFFHQGSRFML